MNTAACFAEEMMIDPQKHIPDIDRTRIIVIEDDAEIASLVARYLRQNDCAVVTAADAGAMDKALRDEEFDIAVLDIGLPGEDGLSICRRLRDAMPDLGVVMLTARGEDIDRIIGLEMGADDYLPKPFNPRELLARIRSVLRRRTQRGTSETLTAKYRFGGWRLMVAEKTLFAPSGAEVTLTAAEHDLLVAFCESSGRVLTRERLVALTHGRAKPAYGRSIDVLVSRLRQKLENDPRDPQLIRTIRGGGYQFMLNVERVGR